MDIKKLITLWNHTQYHKGTTGARCCAAVLLGLYNGARFPLDLSELRCLDSHLRDAAISVISDDSLRCQREVHSWLNHITGRGDFGQRFEALAWEYGTFKRGRCKKDQVERYPKDRMIVELPVDSVA